MTCSYEWHDSFIRVTWLIHMCNMLRLQHRRHRLRLICTCVTWLIPICDMTPSYVCHDSFLRVIWLIHMCDMTLSFEWHASSTSTTPSTSPAANLHKRDIIRSYVQHDVTFSWEEVAAHGEDQTLNIWISRSILFPDRLFDTSFEWRGLMNYLNDGDSVYSNETLFEISGNPVKTCFTCTGTPVKTCWKFWQS